MKNVNPLGLFDEHFRLERLTQLNDPLEYSGEAAPVYRSKRRHLNGADL